MKMDKTMRAVLLRSYGGPEQLYIGEHPVPEPKPKELLVKVHATALNRADILQRQGKYPPPPGESPVLGLEMAGEIAGAGTEVRSWKEGEMVCGLLPGGGYAEYAVIHEDLAQPVPRGLNMIEAAAVPEVFMTAFQALKWLGELQKGEWLLIHAGASGVGTAAIQLAREMEAGGIIVTASREKHGVCLDLGADHAVDYRSRDFREEVVDLTGGRGVAVVLDFIAAPYFQRNLDVLCKDGRLVMLALLGGGEADNVNLAPVLSKRLSIIGTTLRSRSVEYKIRLAGELRDFAWNRFGSGNLKPVIDSVLDWKEVSEAHHYMEENRNLGKIVLKVEKAL